MVLGCVPVAGDGNCLFHALGYLDARDGAALRNEVAAFMVDQACSQEGFEDAWLEEAEELQQGTWGGHAAITAYSLMKHTRVEIHTVQPNGTVVVTDASHGDVGGDLNAPLRRVLYSNDNHYDALVGLLPNPRAGHRRGSNHAPPFTSRRTRSLLPSQKSFLPWEAVLHRAVAEGRVSQIPGQATKRARRAEEDSPRPNHWHAKLPHLQRYIQCSSVAPPRQRRRQSCETTSLRGCAGFR